MLLKSGGDGVARKLSLVKIQIPNTITPSPNSLKIVVRSYKYSLGRSTSRQRYDGAFLVIKLSFCALKVYHIVHWCSQKVEV